MASLLRSLARAAPRRVEEPDRARFASLSLSLATLPVCFPRWVHFQFRVTKFSSKTNQGLFVQKKSRDSQFCTNVVKHSLMAAWAGRC